jgi:hypothetical protein
MKTSMIYVGGKTSLLAPANGMKWRRRETSVCCAAVRGITTSAAICSRPTAITTRPTIATTTKASVVWLSWGRRLDGGGTNRNSTIGVVPGGDSYPARAKKPPNRLPHALGKMDLPKENVGSHQGKDAVATVVTGRWQHRPWHEITVASVGQEEAT